MWRNKNKAAKLERFTEKPFFCRMQFLYNIIKIIGKAYVDLRTKEKPY